MTGDDRVETLLEEYESRQIDRCQAQPKSVPVSAVEKCTNRAIGSS